ncbi:MAG: hypothetical protein U9N35_03590 [Euryarchaeota archaeon]|nr:hypothetical protein [Euryarchaeota archaeon]
MAEKENEKGKITNVQVATKGDTVRIEWNTTYPVRCTLEIVEDTKRFATAESAAVEHHVYTHAGLEPEDTYKLTISCKDCPEKYQGEFSTTAKKET